MKETLPFDFAKDFDHEDERRKRAEKEANSKASIEARKAAEKFANELRRIVRVNQRLAAAQRRSKKET